MCPKNIYPRSDVHENSHPYLAKEGARKGTWNPLLGIRCNET